MRLETFILFRNTSKYLPHLLLLAGLFYVMPASAQVIGLGGTIQVSIPDEGGNVELLPLAGGALQTCTPLGGADCEIIGLAGDDIQFTPLPQSGWGFLEWSIDGGPGIATSPLTEPLPFGGVKTIEAFFGPILSVTVNGSGQGTVSSSEGSIVCLAGQMCQHTYSRSYSIPIQLTAVAEPGSEFVGWNQPGGGNACVNPLANVCELTATGSGFGALPNGVTATFNLVNNDDDGDGVDNPNDQCPNTPAGESVDANGCSASQRDGDSDGIDDGVDQCPDTPPGAEVDESGCTVVFLLEGVLDSDNDGVVFATDLCPDTPADEEVDEAGCSASQRDGDGDGVDDASDACTNTPSGAAVDSSGCSDGDVEEQDTDGDTVIDSDDQCPQTAEGLLVDPEGCADEQKDGDGDGVDDGADQCPETPAGEAADADGCSDSQRDNDGDGVADSEDICPATSATDGVDSDGCDASQRDSDNDGIVDAVDECPATGLGLDINASGCSNAQLDSDGDGINDDVDQCPQTAFGQSVTDTGCTPVEDEIADFGEDLSELQGLSVSEAQVASAIDNLCPRLILADEQGLLTSDQQDLRAACSSLKNKDSTTNQQAEALAVITPEQVSNRTDIALDTGGNQMRQISQRLLRVRSGDARGLSLSGLTLKFDDQAVPGSVIDQAIDTVTDEQSAFQDFGRWGVFVQGDVDVLDRDSSDTRASYESDSWLVTTGVDYRFDNNWYAGVAINYGETDTDYRDASSAVETMGFSLYGGWVFSERGFIDFLIGYLDDDYDLTRRVAYIDSAGSFNALYGASTGGSQLTGGFNFGWMWNQGGWRFGPTASVSFMDGKVSSYQESAIGGDSAAWALQVEETAYSQWSLRLGAQLDYAWLTDVGVIIPGVIANYVAETSREAEDTSALFANDVLGLGDAFTITRDFRDSHYYDVTFNLAGQFSYGISAYSSYRITGGRRGVSHSGYTLGLRWDQAF